ncbi:MAG TPA: WxcM-like domain-containing protein [Thermomicrobiales bacterium]|jgi:dTDP-4-dehydrorhamnose 3,5-epimerase
MEPYLVHGDVAVDDRGQVSFVNGFDVGQARRFFIVSNHQPGFVRAWHGHRRTATYVSAISGAAIVAAVAIDDWERPSRGAPVHRFVLSERKPTMLVIPPGYANGIKTLQADTRLLVFKSLGLEESADDNYRFDARHWDPWDIVER